MWWENDKPWWVTVWTKLGHGSKPITNHSTMLLYRGGSKYERVPFQLLLYTTETTLLCQIGVLLRLDDSQWRGASGPLSRENGWEFNRHCKEVSTSILLLLILNIFLFFICLRSLILFLNFFQERSQFLRHLSIKLSISFNFLFCFGWSI